MNVNDIKKQLEHLELSGDNLEYQLSELTEKWAQDPGGFEAVEPILQFMESNPSLDYGTPGPLVHFAEKFFGNGYEVKLLESIKRKPTSHTLWMLNRLINGTKSPRERERLIGVMTQVRDSASTDADTRSRSVNFLNRLAES